MGERDPVEKGVEADELERRTFFDLAERFRSAANPQEVSRLGDQLGQMVFGG